MRSWNFLIKRIIHTVITLLIVLVLLFIIFRLMPGDPSKFFIKPGMDPDAYHLIAVRYGFEKEILTPGNKYEVVIDTTSPGAYGFAVNVSDTTGNNEKYYSTFNKPGMLYVNNNTTVYNVSISPQPGLNDPVGVNLELLCDSTCPPQFTVNVTHDGGVFNESLTITKGSTDIIGTQERADYIDTTTGTISEFGNYYVNFETKDDDGNAVYNIHGFSINKAPDELLPFTITNLYTEPTLSETRTKVVVSVTLTTSLDKIGLIVTTPAVTVLDQVTMYRSTLFVPVPYWEQFVIYMKNMLTFDFGNSFVSGRPVWDEISQRVPPTLLLFGSALLVAAILGIMFGALMAWRRGSKMEITGIITSLFFYSMPIFWLGLVLLALFGFHLDWFPLRGMLTPGADYQGLEYVADLLWHLTLPLIALSLASLAGWLLLMRNSMLEVMGEDYIVTAKAKGLTDRKVMYKHAARNAMLPIVTAIALSAGHIIGGGVLIETIFAWPGMGYFLVSSTFAYDFPAVQGTFFLLAILTIVANFAADLLYSYLDPRVRLTK